MYKQQKTAVALAVLAALGAAFSAGAKCDYHKLCDCLDVLAAL